MLRDRVQTRGRAAEVEVRRLVGGVLGGEVAFRKKGEVATGSANTECVL